MSLFLEAYKALEERLPETYSPKTFDLNMRKVFLKSPELHRSDEANFLAYLKFKHPDFLPTSFSSTTFSTKDTEQGYFEAKFISYDARIFTKVVHEAREKTLDKLDPWNRGDYRGLVAIAVQRAGKVNTFARYDPDSSGKYGFHLHFPGSECFSVLKMVRHTCEDGRSEPNRCDFLIISGDNYETITIEF